MSWPDQNSSWDVQDNPRRNSQGQQLPENFLKIYQLDFFIKNMTALFLSQELDGSLLIWKKRRESFEIGKGIIQTL